MNCGRTNPHSPHQWVERQRPLSGATLWCEGLPGSVDPQRLPIRYTLGEDARGGDVLEVDERTGRLMRYREPLPVSHGSLELDEALQFAWPFYELVLQRMEYRPDSFARSADACMTVLDEMEER